MTKAPDIQFLSWYQLFFVKSYAISVALGDALTQDHEAKVRLPVTYALLALYYPKRCYSAIECKGLAAVWLVHYFRLYTMRMPFSIITNHSALRALRKK